MFAVPLKSLRRWVSIGHERQKGGGRKVRDPSMEVKLYSWYLECKKQNLFVTPRMVKLKALEFTKHRDFNASKGWLAKFKRKYCLELYSLKRRKELPSGNNNFISNEKSNSKESSNNSSTTCNTNNPNHMNMNMNIKVESFVSDDDDMTEEDEYSNTNSKYYTESSVCDGDESQYSNVSKMLNSQQQSESQNSYSVVQLESK